MELYSDAMSCIFSYDRISESLSILRDLISDISEVITWSYLCDPDFPSSLRHGDEFFGFRIYSPYGVHTTCISEISIDHSRDIDVEYISLFEYLIGTWHTVTDHVIE